MESVTGSLIKRNPSRICLLARAAKLHHMSSVSRRTACQTELTDLRFLLNLSFGGCLSAKIFIIPRFYLSLRVYEANRGSESSEEAKHTLPFTGGRWPAHLYIHLPSSFLVSCPHSCSSSTAPFIVISLLSSLSVSRHKRGKRRRDRESRALSWNESSKLLILLAVSFTPAGKSWRQERMGS